MSFLKSQIEQVLSVNNQQTSMTRDEIVQEALNDGVDRSGAYAYHSGGLRHCVNSSSRLLLRCHRELDMQSDRIEFLEEKFKMLLDMIDDETAEKFDDCL